MTMMAHGLLSKVAATVLTGALGAAAYDLLRRAAATAPVHEVAVTTTEWGLRGVRKAEEGAESARLKVADVVSEARERIGEESPPPGVTATFHDHDH
jgi:peroxiredoxin family protein